MRLFHHGGLILALALLTTGCAITPKQPPSDTAQQQWQAHLQTLATLNNWELSGRIAVKTGQESLSGTLHWKQQADFYDIRIIGPLGRGSVSLLGDQQQSVLTTHEGKSFSAGNAQALLHQHLGLDVPLDYLRYWLLGKPAPDLVTEDLQLDETGRLGTLRQAGWEISYRGYTDAPGLSMPARIFINNHLVSVRLVVDQWTIPAS
ncbi:MAG: outer membrane lipoprotein LolB [Gammaproteobacteria bacterium RBG_16_57_12]|nr:MAG: outer membrane lipoprotein LolB [Gammaproteobacteria bacterium RBG_16_57_12]